MTRDVIKVELDKSKLSSGEVTIGWALLEKNDAAVVQLIYAGDESIDLKAAATVEGQSKIEELTYKGNGINSPEETYAADRRHSSAVAVLPILGGALLIVGIVGVIAFSSRDKHLKFAQRRVFSFTVLTCIAAVLLIVSLIEPVPPIAL